MLKNFSARIKVQSSDELTSLLFAFRIIPLVGQLLEREPKTAVIVPGLSLIRRKREISAALGDQAKHCRFLDSDTWKIETAGDQIVEFANAGINTVILSEEYLVWCWLHESSHQSLIALDECIDRHEMTLVVIGSLAERETNFERLFSQVPQWEWLTLDQILERMIQDYRHTTITATVDTLPYFILSPSVTMHDVLIPEIRAIAGYERWVYNVVVMG